MKCQHEEDGVVCGQGVGEYRQCGRGCRREIGYCPAHGGIERATDEVVAHHKEHDRGVELILRGVTITGVKP